MALDHYCCECTSGLPSTVISLLSLAARNMALRFYAENVSVRGDAEIDVHYLLDKTGTLTKNEMTVTGVWFNQRPRSASPCSGSHKLCYIALFYATEDSLSRR
jgi:magnesium-transporting ATPase (P-type)